MFPPLGKTPEDFFVGPEEIGFFAMNSAVVYIVATPIGHLDDLTPRARRVLETVDLIAAEDTRVTRKLLSHLGIQGKRLVAYQDYNEEEQARRLVQELQSAGTSLAVVSDAGTPCIADPGYRIVAMAKASGIPVHPIPGPSALTALVSASGLPSDRLLFVGFLPAKPSAQRTEIESWAKSGAASIVFFEPTRRLARTLHLIAEIHPHAQVSVGRELTKMFEEIVTLPVGEAIIWATSHATLKGEASVMVAIPRRAMESHIELSPQDLVHAAAEDFRQGASLKDLLQKYGDAGYKRTDLYKLLLEAKAL